MNKLLLLALLALVVYSQPPPAPSSPSSTSMDGKEIPPAPSPDEEDEEMQIAMMEMVEVPAEDWYCDFEFWYNGNPYFYESLSYDAMDAYHGKLPKKYDNKIDSVYWSGTRCYCWVIVYESNYWTGLNLGLWVDSTEGYYDLNKYITYNASDYAWESWSSTISSYSIYCY